MYIGYRDQEFERFEKKKTSAVETSVSHASTMHLLEWTRVESTCPAISDALLNKLYRFLKYYYACFFNEKEK